VIAITIDLIAALYRRLRRLSWRPLFPHPVDFPSNVKISQQNDRISTFETTRTQNDAIA
jgi:hypothetical protein